MKLKDALGFVSLKFKQPSVCESCGNEFTCGATIRGCWCADIKLSDETRQDLRSKFKDCLCRDCLEKYPAPAILVKFPDGSTEFIAGAVRVDTQNFHEGMFDFYDSRGNLLKQIDMGSGISWEDVSVPRNPDD
jgi:hypothetical protein